MTKLPNADKVTFKDAFIERYSELTDFEKFKEISLTYPRKAIRVNTLKISVKDLVTRLEAKGWTLTPVPWCPEGFWIEGAQTDIGNLLEHTLGYIYVQDPSSMIPPVVLNPKPEDLVLDMCAAPGSKATQIAAMLQNKGLLIANDEDYNRLKALGMNMQRVGAHNTIITKMHGRNIKNQQFDKILVDAPCSGTGTICKSLRVLQDWSPNLVKRVAGQQRQLLQTAFNNLKKGGEVVYSTCTMEPQENEGVISWLLENNADVQILPIELLLKRSDAITSFDGTQYDSRVKDCLRIWPQDNNTEGFFVCKIRKNPENL
ncbi:RsmB/NOP family class I SAM-dependent RNA methyltransferase [Candidatus Woesearchaeota archaeon]|nr:RsmB/NOP family class I SAM-dependent RNA methyltransferase [Candidatus Woesearchaeota archaeon]